MSGLRIGVFNTHLDSVMFEIAKKPEAFVGAIVLAPVDPIPLRTLFNNHDIDMTNQAELIADRIVFGTMPSTLYRYDYDVIALNEVFSEPARRILLNHSDLKAAYPYRIGKLPPVVPPVPHAVFAALEGIVGKAMGPVLSLLGIDWHDIGEDSGLMLFSRYPIDPPRFEPFTFASDEEIKFAMYDSLAAKGAAYVRISNPITGEAFNLVFTHLQEDKEEWAGIRANQLKQIETLIRSVMTETMIKDEDIFVVGDLNIIGNWNYVGDPPKPPDDIINDVKRKGTDEWEHHFNSPVSFFTTAVHDAWFYETSTKDEGPKTEGGTGNRLDYILHNPKLASDTKWKVQHLTTAYNLHVNGGNPSDHNGLNADLNRYARHCNPREALVHGGVAYDRFGFPRPELIFKSENIHGALKYPGSMMWHRLDEPGTYSIAVPSGGGMEFTIYSNLDLSLPWGQYKDETREFTGKDETKFTAKKYVMVDPPYYIRVYHPDRTVTGDYTLFVHKHRGVDPDDAIVLLPHKPLDAPDFGWFPIGSPLNLTIRCGSSSTHWGLIDFHLEAASPSKSSAKCLHTPNRYSA